jgi:hypothetical protein
MLHSMSNERSHRKRQIRARVLGGGVALFVAVWLVIAVTLASGHDPGLSKTASAHVRKATTATATTAASAPTTTTTTSTTASPSPVVTSQS